MVFIYARIRPFLRGKRRGRETSLPFRSIEHKLYLIHDLQSLSSLSVSFLNPRSQLYLPGVVSNPHGSKSEDKQPRSSNACFATPSSPWLRKLCILRAELSMIQGPPPCRDSQEPLSGFPTSRRGQENSSIVAALIFIASLRTHGLSGYM